MIVIFSSFGFYSYKRLKKEVAGPIPDVERVISEGS
jgi:hypothetical protein